MTDREFSAEELLERACRDEQIAKDLMRSGDTQGAQMYFDLARRTFNEALKAEEANAE